MPDAIATRLRRRLGIAAGWLLAMTLPAVADLCERTRFEGQGYVVCRLEARDLTNATVGRTEVTVPPTEDSPSRHVASVETASPASTAMGTRSGSIWIVLRNSDRARGGSALFHLHARTCAHTRKQTQQKKKTGSHQCSAIRRSFARRRRQRDRHPCLSRRRRRQAKTKTQKR